MNAQLSIYKSQAALPANSQRATMACVATPSPPWWLAWLAPLCHATVGQAIDALARLYYVHQAILCRHSHWYWIESTISIYTNITKYTLWNPSHSPHLSKGILYELDVGEL